MRAAQYLTLFGGRRFNPDSPDGLLSGYSSGMALSAFSDSLLIRQSGTETYRGNPGAKFTPAVGIKYIFGSDGLLKQQRALFGTHDPVNESISFPDAIEGVVGEGFTCTGLAWDSSRSTFWVGNFGAPTDADATSQSSLVQMTAAGVKVSEIDLFALYGGGFGGIQGVAWDSSDDSLWVAGMNFVYHLTPAGVDLADGFALANANGLAYESTRDCLWTGVGTALVRRSKAGAALDTYAITPSIDHVFYDAPRDYVWITAGLNGGVGEAYAYNAADGALVGSASFPDVTAIEGMLIKDGSFYVCHDGYYHNEALYRKNRLYRYDTVQGSHAADWALDHEPLTGAAKGYVMETACTSLLWFNRAFENGQWIKQNCTVPLADVAVAPDGTLTAERWIATAGTSNTQLAQGNVGAAGSDIEGVFAKKDTYRYLWIGDRSGDGIFAATFDLQDGVVVGQNASTVASITPLPNGWYYCHINYPRATGTAGGITLAHGNSSHGADLPTRTWLGTEALFVWGAQDAHQPYQTSPLLSVATRPSRLADAPTLATTEFAWSATENTFVFQARTARGAGTQTLWQAGTADDGMKLYRNSSNEIHFVVTVGAATQADLSLGVVANATSFKVAVRAKANDFAASLDGAAVVTDTSGTLPTIAIVRAGHSAAGEQWNGWLYSAAVIPQGLADADLITKSTP
jgi:hypothetical protein